MENRDGGSVEKDRQRDGLDACATNREVSIRFMGHAYTSKQVVSGGFTGRARRSKSEINIGDRFGRLVVIGHPQLIPGSAHKNILTCCDCGNKQLVRIGSLKACVTKSCGCLRKGRLR